LTNGLVRRRLVLSEKRMLQERWWVLAAKDEETLTQSVARLS